jgi:exosortase O
MATLDSLAGNLKRASAHPNLVRIVANALMVASWLWLYRAVFDYLAIIFTREDFRTNQIVLIGIIVLIVLQARRENWQIKIDTPPQMFVPAFTLVLGGSVLYLLVERLLDINTLSASLFGLASYGLLGLWVSPSRWRDGLPAALLIVGVLPFGEHMQTFIGYPMRITTAAIVRDGLAALGITSVGVDTILVLENGVSQIDIPCSGVKSLWTGALFLLAATWLERRPLNVRWFLIALAFAVILFLTNLARVTLLVFVGQVANLRIAAEMIHVPLGVLGFVLACAAAVLMLRWQKIDGRRVTDDRRQVTSPRFSFALAAMLLVFGLLYTQRPQTGLSQPAPAWIFPADLSVQPLPLKPDEIAWLMRDNAESADRFQFEYRNISGSLILIASKTWRAHHRPERCFEVYGLALDDSSTQMVAPDFPIRAVALSNQRTKETWSAAYWFQSAGRTTDDYGTRIWDDVTLHPQRWVLVSIVFNRALEPNDADAQAFYLALRASIAQNLVGR